MRKTVLAAVAAIGALSLATAANAALVVTLGTPAADGSISGTFASRDLGSGMFDESVTFALPTGMVSSTITSTFQGGLTNVDFTVVSMNGQNFTPIVMGQNEFRVINNLNVASGTQTIRVMGNSAGEGSYSGTIAFSPTAVPEPASWALMISGFGAAGALLRRRRNALTFA